MRGMLLGDQHVPKSPSKLPLQMLDAAFTLDMLNRRKSQQPDDRGSGEQTRTLPSTFLLTALCSSLPAAESLLLGSQGVETFHSFCKKGPEIEILVQLCLLFWLDSDPMN